MRTSNSTLLDREKNVWTTYLCGDDLWSGADAGWYWGTGFFQDREFSFEGDTFGPFETKDLAVADFARETGDYTRVE